MSQENTEFFNPKLENLPYTVAIIKPDTTLVSKNVQDIINKIEEQGFIIKNMIQRELIKEEALNLYYKHKKQPFFDELMEYMLSGECVVLLICHETENPIEKWKNLIGPTDPEEAKKQNPQLLRGIYGKSAIKNELHGSQNMIEANKERDIFKFPIPQKIPEFKFDRMKITLDTLLKFIYPPNLEHPSVNERLDIFALYGPVVNYHSVDQCLCKECALKGKNILEIIYKQKLNEEKQKLGLSTKNDDIIEKFEKTLTITNKGEKIHNDQKKNTNTNPNNKQGQSTEQQLTDQEKRQKRNQYDSKVRIAPIRLLQETQIQQLYNDFCLKCKQHCDQYAHLPSGRDNQHIVTDLEINELATEINKQELLDLLVIEKGNAAKIMLESIPIKEPEAIIYGKDIIKELLKDLPTDYYNRYDFYDMQQVILEDRRIRMNYWVSILINKPIERFKNPKLIDPTVTQEERKNLKSIHFTLNRTLPLSLTFKKKNIAYVDTNFPVTLIDKPKLQPNEEKLALLQRLNRHMTHICSIDNVNQNKESTVTGVSLLRDGYNEGRNGQWNNYCTLKGQNKGSYVQTKNYTKQSEFDKL